MPRPPAWRPALKAALLAISIAALAGAAVLPLLLRPYPGIGLSNGGYLSLSWTDGSCTQHPDGIWPFRGGGSIGPLVWLEWTDGSYSLHLRQHHRRRIRHAPVPPPMRLLGVPSVSDFPPF